MTDITSKPASKRLTFRTLILLLIPIVLLAGVIACVAGIPSVDLARHQYIPYRELGMLLSV